MPKVLYTLQNVEKCQCGSCPVYLASAKAKAKNASLDWSPGNLPPADEIEGIYCAEAVGKTKVDDLDGNKPCNCPGCPVWEECGLNGTYYCLRGAAT